MGLFDKYDKKKQKELTQLIKEKRKSEEKLEKEMKNRMNTKYTTQYLKENKKLLTQNAMTIDKEEYTQMVMEMKKRFENK